MKNTVLILTAALALAGCSTSEILYRPAEQKLPQHIKKIAVRPFINKTPQFGLEEKLTYKVIDEFLKNGEYSVTQETSADGVIAGEITNYILTPIQYDVNLVPTVYKISVLAVARMLDRENNRYLWEEPALQVTKIYSASTMPGGMSEEQARETLWEILSKDIVRRTVGGFGSVTGVSQKGIPQQNPPARPASNAAIEVSSPTGK